MPPAPTPSIRELVEAVYAALGAGDQAALRSVLADDFRATFAAGMPLGLGGVRVGPDAAIREGWWPIGRAFAVRARPERWLQVGPGQLVVTGHYGGKARDGGGRVDASFAHVWDAAGGRLVALEQITDTAAWHAALGA